MNQSGTYKTLGAMLLASGATLAIVIVSVEAIRGPRAVKYVDSQPSSFATAPDGLSSWGPSQYQPSQYQPSQYQPSPHRPSQWQSQNHYSAHPHTDQYSRPSQTHYAQTHYAQPHYVRTDQANYVANSRLATNTNATQLPPRSHHDHSNQMPHGHGAEYENLPAFDQANHNSSGPIARPQAMSGYSPSNQTSGVPDSLAHMAPSTPTPMPMPQQPQPAATRSDLNRQPEASILTQVSAESVVNEHAPPEALGVIQTGFENRVSEPETFLSFHESAPQVLGDKQDLKIREVIIKNDTYDDSFIEIEAPVASTEETAAKPTPNLHSEQPATLPRQPVAPQVEVRARQRIKYGESLVRRRSFFAAREEFVLALLLIANSHGEEATNNAHADRLAKALTAVEEIEGFASMLNRDGSDPQFQQLVHSHRTRLLAGPELSSVSPRKAIDLYCGYAQSQIEQAIGFSAAGSEALHALGKLELMAPASDPQGTSTSRTRALVLFRASLSVNRSNATCGNDLGVLLFNMGRLDEAEEWLRLSLASTQSRLTWTNLASVHKQQASTATTPQQRDNYVQLTQLATHEAQQFQNDPRDSGLADEEWATTNEFKNNAAFPDTVVQQTADRGRDVDTETPQRSGARVKAVSFLQKVTGRN